MFHYDSLKTHSIQGDPTFNLGFSIQIENLEKFYWLMVGLTIRRNKCPKSIHSSFSFICIYCIPLTWTKHISIFPSFCFFQQTSSCVEGDCCLSNISCLWSTYQNLISTSVVCRKPILWRWQIIWRLKGSVWDPLSFEVQTLKDRLINGL